MTFLSLFVYSSQFFQINPPTHRHVCTHTHIHTHIPTPLFTYAQSAWIQLQSHAYRRPYTYSHVCIYKLAHMYTYTHLLTHMSIQMHMDISTCTEAHSCSFTGLHTHMHGNTESLILSICVLSLEKSTWKEELSWRRQDGAHLIISPHLCA